VAPTPDRLDQLLADIKAEFPRFRLIRKDESATQRLIHYALVAVTFGGMRSYLTGYQTTIRSTIYVTPDWGEIPRDERWITLRHERVHLRQFRRFTTPGMALLYVLLPLPMGLAWFRARFEQEAYAETIRSAAAIHGPDHVRQEGYRDRILRQFTGPAYGWMWPFRRDLERWYDSVLTDLYRAG
jgi:hypothetical protein